MTEQDLQRLDEVRAAILRRDVASMVSAVLALLGIALVLLQRDAAVSPGPLPETLAPPGTD